MSPAVVILGGFAGWMWALGFATFALAYRGEMTGARRFAFAALWPIAAPIAAVLKFWPASWTFRRRVAS